MRDELVDELIDAERVRQREGLELIPSENYASEAVRRALASEFTNKYAEGYPSFDGLGYVEGESEEEWRAREAEIAHEILPSRRYYGGQENTDRMERLAIARACRLFHANHANVQPHSGAQANNAVYFAWLKPGDVVLGMDLGHGGHLTHGAPVTQSAQFYKFVGYGTTNDGEIDYEEMERLAREYRPRILLVGYSAHARVPDFERIAEIGRAIPDCLMMADMAHVAGLIAGGAHPNPLDFGFQVMTTTTHKTLRGPRGGMILSRGKVGNPLRAPERHLENIPTLIDRAVFPGTQGGPLMNTVAAKAVALGEALRPEFREYAKNVVKNTTILARELVRRGFSLVGGGSENHLILIDVMKSFGFDGKEMERRMDLAGLTANANAIPNDVLPPFRPSGLRIGTAAMTTRGLGEAEMVLVAEWMERLARSETGELEQVAEKARSEMMAMLRKVGVKALWT